MSSYVCPHVLPLTPMRRCSTLLALLLAVASVWAQTPNPTPAWVRVAGGPGHAVVLALDAVSVGADPSLAAVGTFENVLSFGAGGSPLVAPGGSAAAFVSVFSLAWQNPGELRWQRRMACLDGCAVRATGVAMRPSGGSPAPGSGEVAVVGWAVGPLTVDGGGAPDVTLGHDGARDGFVALFTLDGRLVWAERLGGGGDALPAAVEFVSFPTSPPALRVSGRFTGDVTWAAEAAGTAGATSAGGTDGFVVSYGLNGSVDGALVVGSGSDDALAGLDGAWVAGTFRDTLVLGQDTLVSRGGSDALALLLTESLAIERVYSFGGEGNDEGHAITYATEDGWSSRLLLSGTFTGTVPHEHTPLTSAGGTDIFHVWLPGTGWPPLPSSIPWSIGSTADDSLGAVAAGAGWYGDIGAPFPVAVGWTAGRMALPHWNGPILLPSLGGTDGFAIGSSYGEMRGTQVGGPGTDRVHAAVATGGYSMVVGGSFQESLRMGTLDLPGQAPDDDDAFIAFYGDGMLTPYYIAAEPAPEPSIALAVAPNPSLGEAVVRLALEASAAHVTVRVHDALGRVVAVLHDGPLGGEASFALPASLVPGRYLVRASGDAMASAALTVVR